MARELSHPVEDLLISASSICCGSRMTAIPSRHPTNITGCQRASAWKAQIQPVVLETMVRDPSGQDPAPDHLAGSSPKAHGVGGQLPRPASLYKELGRQLLVPSRGSSLDPQRRYRPSGFPLQLAADYISGRHSDHCSTSWTAGREPWRIVAVLSASDLRSRPRYKRAWRCL